MKSNLSLARTWTRFGVILYGSRRTFLHPMRFGISEDRSRLQVLVAITVAGDVDQHTLAELLKRA